MLYKEFEEEISFLPSGKFVIVHASSVNPCEYSLATRQEAGLRDEDFVRSFANHVRKKMAKKDNENDDVDSTPDGIIEGLSKGPLHVLYNVIFATMYTSFSFNSYGYASTESFNQPTKIWSLASEWQSLIYRQPTSVQKVQKLSSTCIS